MRLLYRIDELRQREARALAELPAGTLMQRAGRAAAMAAHDAFLARPGSPGGMPRRPAPVLVLCGPGDNGGDGYECALALQAMGYPCRCWSADDGAKAGAQALAARRRWAAVGPIDAALTPAPAPELVVDALLGIGATRPLEGALLAATRWLRDSGLPVLALDVPSGLDADTGCWIGGVAGAAARLTLTFLGDKPGLHLRQGRAAAGLVRVALLGVAEPPAASIRGRLAAPGDFTSLLLPRPDESNKGSFGTVNIIGGAPGMVGAVLLAGRAALRLGAGKVYVDAIGAPDLRVDLQQPELMLQAQRRPAPDDVLLIGCGMGTAGAARQLLHDALSHPGPLLIDADAINLLATDPDARAALAARAAPTVITPHPGEAARVLQATVATVQADRIASATQLADTLRATVVLKGAATVIAEPGGRYAINPTGGPALASAGTGDVLAGMIAALLAQGADAATAAGAAAWLHGAAADRHGADVGLVASDIAPLAAREWARLRAASVAGDNAAGLERNAAAASLGEAPIVRDQDQR